jgi:hypothetical protein
MEPPIKPGRQRGALSLPREVKNVILKRHAGSSPACVRSMEQSDISAKSADVPIKRSRFTRRLTLILPGLSAPPEAWLSSRRSCPGDLVRCECTFLRASDL